MFDIIIRSLNALLMIAMPLALGIYLYRKLGAEWRLFGVGAVTFVASQVFHIPFNMLVLDPLMERLGLDPNISIQLAVIALLLGLSAGVFEEVARYIAYRFWLKKECDRTWSSALMFGAGHGGIEAIILGVLVTYGFIQLFALKDANLEALIPLDQLEVTRAQVDLFWSAPWYATILGAVERAATLCFHLSATVLVLQVFRRGSIFWLLLAIGWHAAIDAMAVFASQTWSIYFTEALIVGAGLLALLIIFALREMPAKPDDETPTKIEEKPIEIETRKPSLDHLEDSRYA
ncbi:YhfC family intramembrane metalloprotease [Chloroflexota bacterium]